MSIQLKYQLEQRIDKAIKQLPYSQSKEDFVLTALNNYFDLLMRQRLIKQKIHILNNFYISNIGF